MSNPDVEHAPETRTRRRYPAWTVVAVAAAVIAGGALVLVAVAAFMAPSSVDLAKMGLARTTLRDGTVLVVEYVSVGREHHFVQELASSPWDVFGGSQRHFDNTVSMPWNIMMVWISRHDPKTGAALDLDWWTRTVAIDDSGWAVEDENARRVARSRHSENAESSTRPFSPLPERFERIDGYSMFPLMHMDSGTLRLKIFGVTGLAGEVIVPVNPIPAPFASLKAEPLPATRTRGDLQATLNGFKLIRHVDLETDAQAPPRWEVLPQLDFVKSGETRTTDWVINHDVLHDAHGNAGNGTQWIDGAISRVNPFDPAWKFAITVSRKADAQFDAHETWELGLITLPRSGVWEAAGTSHIVNGYEVRYLGIGTGNFLYRDRLQAKAHDSGSVSSGDVVDGHAYQARVDLQSDSRAIQVASDMPCLAFDILRVVDPSREYREILVRVTDERGQPISTHRLEISGVQLYFLLPQPELKAVNVRVIVHKSAQFEFTVAPPAELRTPVENPVPGEVTSPAARGEAGEP